MAGIGFKLRTLFQKDSYFDTLRGIIYSTAIAGGPIFFSILCLIMLGIFSTAFLTSQDMRIFLVTIVYVFAFSLISTGFSQLLITRYLSDLIYKNKPGQILPTFTTVLVMTMIFQFVIGLPFILLWQTSLVYKTSALMLFITVGCIWQLMIFLSALRNYKIVLFAFLTGLIISVIFALVLGKKIWPAGIFTWLYHWSCCFVDDFGCQSIHRIRQS